MKINPVSEGLDDGDNAGLEPNEQELAGRIEATFRRALFETPSEEEVCRELGLSPHLFRRVTSLLIREKKLVRLDKKVTYHREALDDAREIVLNHLRKSGHITIAELKESLHTSLKYACALLEYFDTIRLTKRNGDAHELR